MKEWTAIATVRARPEAVLDVLTDPEAARRWAPIEFDVDGVRGRLRSGSRAYVSGRLAGRYVEFEVEVHEAEDGRLHLRADGPIGFDVRYDLRRDDDGAEFDARVSMRPSRGLTGKIVANAASALLSAGALDGAARRIARAAELAPSA